MTDRELYLEAKKVLDKAYCPYSNFQVGAAILTTEGEVFTGVNIENSTFGATICAERTACVKAVSEGYQSFAAIAVVSCRGDASPCGICRQFLYEFSPNMDVISGVDEDHLAKVKLEELLPEGFKL